MIVVDSSGWLEYLQETPRAPLFEPALRDPDGVIVPGICLFEVHRLLAAKLGDTAADAAASLMRKCRVAALDADLAQAASAFARQHRLALADALIYATARGAGAELWTQDADFKDLPGVRFFPKPE